MMVIVSSLNIIGLSAYPNIENYNYYAQPAYNVYSEGQPFQNHVIFSNLTKKYYSFYSIQQVAGAGNTGLRYDVLNYDGSIYLQDNSIGSGAIYEGTPYGDYDVRISLNGDKAYLFFLYDAGNSQLNQNKDVIYVLYLAINTSTLLLDNLATTTINTLSTVSTSNAVRHIMGAITLQGYPCFVVDFRITVSPNQYSSHAVFSNSLTNFVVDYNMNIETLFFDKTSINPWAKNLGTITTINPYGTNGVMIIYSPVDTDNLEHDKIISFKCPTYSTLLGGYNAADWTIDYLESSDISDHSNYVNCDVSYNYDNDICFVWERWLTTNLRYLYAYVWNVGTDSWNKKIIVNAGSSTVEYPVFTSTNDRGIFNVISANTIDNDFYIYKYNIGTSTFDSISSLWEYSSIDDAINNNEVFINQYCPNFGSGIYSNGTICTLLIDGHSVPTDDNYIAFFGLDVYMFPPLPINYIELDNIDNNIADNYGVLIFPNDAHNIEMNFEKNTTYVYIDIEDAENYIRFNYNVTENRIYTTITNKKGDAIKRIAYVDNKIITDNGNNITLSFDFTFNNDMIDYYSQILDYGLLYKGEWFNFTSQIKYSLFNLGGIPVYSGSGTYNIYSDNDIFSIGAYGDGSWIRFDTLYRKLQHMHFNVELDISGDWNSGDGVWENCTGGLYEYGFDYFINDELLEGWKVRIYPSSVVVGHQNLGVDFDYIQWTIEHYFFDRTLDDYQLVKTDFLYSNFNGYDNEDSTPDYHNRTSTTFWFDMWFSNDNSSRKIATRINTEWYGMYEQGSSWWFGYGEFRPVIGELTNSIFYDNVYDVNEEITTVKGNVDLVRFWGRTEKVTGGSHEYKMYNYLMKNKILAIDEMIGIDTPPLVETKVMDMPQTGFLAPLIKILSDIQKMIIMGIVGALGYLATLIDSMLVNLGLPPLLSIFYDIIISIYDIFAMLYSEFMNIMIWIIDALDNVISSLFLIIPKYLLFVGMIVDVFIQYYNTAISLFTGGIGGMANFWNDYPVSDFIQLYLICIFPFMEIAKIESSKDPIGTLTQDVKTFVDMIMGLFNFLYALVQMIADLIGRILGILPF